MKFLKSLGIIVLSLLVIFGIVLFILSKTGIITDYAKSIAESEVAKLTGKNVRIEKIELGLFNHITIKNISIPVGTSFNDGGEFASVKNVYIRFNVMDIFSGEKSIDKTLSSIVGQGAVVYVRKEGDTVNLLKFLKSFHIRSSGGAPPINKIFVEDGKVIYEDKEKNFVTSITGIKGTVVLRVAKNTVDAVDVYVNARTPDSIGRNVAVAVRYSFPQEKIRINVKADKMPLKVFGNYFAGAKEYAFTKGYLALNAVAERVKDQVIPFDIKGEAKVKDAELTSSSGITLTAQTGIAKIENNNIEITGVLFTALNGSGRIDGSINDIFNKLEYNIHILAKDIELQQPTDGLLEGGVQADVLIKGAKLSKLLAVGNLNWAEGKVAGIPTKMSAVTFDFANKKLSLKKVKGIFAEGAVEGTGYISFEKETSPSKIDFTATAVDFKLLTKNENTSGKINATGKLTGPIKSPRLEMTAFSEGMNFAAADPKKINAYAVIEKSKLTGDAVFNFRKYEALKLSTRINFIKGKLDIAEILVNTVKEKMIVGKGYYFIKEKAIGAALNYKGLDINKMNISYMTGKDMSVGGGGYLTLSGTTEALALDVYFKSDYFKTRNKDYTLKFNFNYSDNALNIKNFDFNKNLLAEASYSLSKKVFLNKAQINNLDGNVLAELTGMKFFENSILNGTVDIKKLDSGYAGNVKVGMAYSQGGYESGYLDINGDNNRFNINRVEIKQQTGLLKANGTFSVWNDTQLKTDLSGVLNDYKINDRLTINGVFVATSKVETGTKNITSVNTLKVEKILLNGKKMDETELVVKTENLYLPYFKVTSGKAYNISGAIAPDATGKKAINMDVRLDNADLYPVYTLLNLRDKPLDASSVLKGVIKIEGTLEALKLAADIYQKEGNIHISGDMTGEKKGGAYALSEIGRAHV